MADAGMQEAEAVEIVLGAGAPELAFSGKKKKKKTKRKPFLAELADEQPLVGEHATSVDPPTLGVRGTERSESSQSGGSGERAQGVTPEWKEYEYSEMLELIYLKMRKRRMAGTAGGREGGPQTRFVVVPPQVVKLGSKKSGFVNFGKVCEQIGREPAHIKRYLEVELGASGTMDGQGVLVFRGKFGRGEVEVVLSKYIKEFVRCRTCRGYSTRLEKDKATRLTFLVCEGCSARSTAGAIEDGFSALTEKRSRVRRREGK
jgi:translation initiation factor 2 subunit 2